MANLSPEFTPAVVRAILVEKVLPGPSRCRTALVLPEPADIEELARCLEVNRHRVAVFSGPDAELAKLCLVARQQLEDAIATLAQMHARAVKLSLGHAERYAIAGQRVSDVLQLAILVTREPARRAAWQAFGLALAGDFHTAMKGSNPRFAAAKISHAGPLPRFIAAVAPILTGEHPTVASVATILKQQRAAGLLDRLRREKGIGGKSSGRCIPR